MRVGGWFRGLKGLGGGWGRAVLGHRCLPGLGSTGSLYDDTLFKCNRDRSGVIVKWGAENCRPAMF